MSQAQIRKDKLESGIQEAQTRESQILEMSQWMSEVGSLLQSRLDADILAGDIPKEYEVNICDICLNALFKNVELSYINFVAGAKKHAEGMRGQPAVGIM